MPRKKVKNTADPALQKRTKKASEGEVLEPEVIEVEPAAAADPGRFLPAEAPESYPAESGRDTSVPIPYDPLTAYLAEVRRIPRLTEQEERALAERYAAGKDRNAAYRLVSGNLWLVIRVAREYERAARNLLDLIQEGNMGLMEAVKNFDPYRGVRFPSYASWWIRAYIVRYVIANWRLVKIGTTQAQRKLFFNLNKEKEQLEREGFTPGTKLIADRLNVRESDVIEMEQRLSGADVSVDQPTDEESDGNLLSVLPSGAATAEDLLLNDETRRLIKDGIESFSAELTEKELLIFNERMLAENKATLQEMADKLDISRERVRQIENRIKERMKEYFLKKLGFEPERLDF